MIEYIPKQKALDEIEEWNIVSFYELNEHSREAYQEIKMAISSLPPADVRPVVRCRECRYSREPDRHSLAEFAACEGVLICFVGYDHVYPSLSNDVFVDGEHFCGYGEVRDG